MVTLLIKLRSLTKSLQPKVMAIQEAKDLTLLLDHLFGSLTTHEMMTGEDPSKQKKIIAFKASVEIKEELDDEDLVLLVHAFPK